MTAPVLNIPFTPHLSIMTARNAAAYVNSVSARARASSVAFVIGARFATAATPAPASAQQAQRDSARAAADSLAARLRRAEEAIALLQQQLGEQAASGVSTRSRMRLEFNGRVLVHAFRNDRRVNNVDDPQFVRPDTASVLPVAALGLAIRQTTLGLVVNTRDVLGGRFVGDIDVDFYGGLQPSSGGRTFPLLRIRTARGARRGKVDEWRIDDRAGVATDCESQPDQPRGHRHTRLRDRRESLAVAAAASRERRNGWSIEFRPAGCGPRVNHG